MDKITVGLLITIMIICVYGIWDLATRNKIYTFGDKNKRFYVGVYDEKTGNSYIETVTREQLEDYRDRINTWLELALVASNQDLPARNGTVINVYNHEEIKEGK
jgi:hypothetical protein